MESDPIIYIFFDVMKKGVILSEEEIPTSVDFKEEIYDFAKIHIYFAGLEYLLEREIINIIVFQKSYVFSPEKTRLDITYDIYHYNSRPSVNDNFFSNLDAVIERMNSIISELDTIHLNEDDDLDFGMDYAIKFRIATTDKFWRGIEEIKEPSS